VVRNLNTSHANELSMMKTKFINMEERERHREAKNRRLEKDRLGSIVVDQEAVNGNECAKE